MRIDVQDSMRVHEVFESCAEEKTRQQWKVGRGEREGRKNQNAGAADSELHCIHSTYSSTVPSASGVALLALVVL